MLVVAEVCAKKIVVPPESAAPDSRGDARVQCTAVLLVEDDPDIRESVAALLASEGYRVFTAENGSQALQELQRLPEPVLILADLSMPIMNGWKFLEHLHADDRFAILPVVIVSGEEDTPKGYRLVKKPVNPDELLSIVAAHCEAARRD